MTTPSPTSATQAQSHTHEHEKPPHVTWDEETIALHDAERGTRMKIEEPKTPYHYYGSDGDVSPARSLSGKEGAPPIEWADLQVKLEGVETKQQQQKQKESEWDSSDDEAAGSPSGGPRFATRDAEGKKIEKDPKFASKRKNHYNEFQAMKMWRQQHAEEEEDEEDEDATSKADGKPRAE